MRFQNSGMSSILEGLSVSRKEINEAKKIDGYMMFTNLDKSGLEEYKGFISDVEKFAKGILPHTGMDGKRGLSMVLDIGNVVGSSVGTSILFYGFGDDFEDEMDFESVWDRNKMEKYIKGLVSSFPKLKKFEHMETSTYLTAKRKFQGKKSKTIEVGPYVEVFYDNNEIIDESVVSEGVKEITPAIKKGLKREGSFDTKKFRYFVDNKDGWVKKVSLDVLGTTGVYDKDNYTNICLYSDLFESVVSEGVDSTVTMDSVTSKKTLKELAKKYGTAKDKKGNTYVFTIQPYDDISVDDDKYGWDYLETIAVKIGDEIKNGKAPSYLIVFSDDKVDYVSKMSNVSIQ